MCQFERCGCKPVQSGRNGPQVDVVVDRRVRPWVGTERTSPDEAWVDLTVPVADVAGMPSQERVLERPVGTIPA